MKLYIIGNGFDLAHNFGTSYVDYRTYIKNNLKSHPKWECILYYYPDNYEYWSDIEYNVCNFNKDLYFSQKNAFSFGLLDELLRQTHSSFENFLLNVETKVLSSKPIFKLDIDSLFLSFNYTTTLEDVYKVPKEKIIYVHNDIGGPAMDIMYNIPNHTPCVIGHSPVPNDYFHYNDSRLMNDVEYTDFVRNTTKDCSEIIERRKIDVLLINNKQVIDEVVFYGFSFSITDKAYVQLIFSIFKDKNIRYKIYYKVGENSSDIQCKNEFRNKLLAMNINCNYIEFINCDTTKCI